MKEILVCLDGSRSSRRALEMALGVARHWGATLVGMAVIISPGGDDTAGDAHQAGETWLADFTARCRQAQVKSQVLGLGAPPAQSVLEQVQRHDLSFIGRQVALHTETNAEDPRLRDRILPGPARPIVLVPELVPESPPDPDSRSDVLIAYDGSSAAKRAVRSFAASGLGANRAIHVASVDDVGRAAWETASRGVEVLEEAGLTATIHSEVSPLGIDEALLALARRLNVGLLVMGAYTRSRPTPLLWGAVTNGLMNKTSVPLYLHH